MKGWVQKMKLVRKVLTAIFLIFIAAISVVPFLWVLSSSFKSNSEIMSSVVGYPNGLNLKNYVKAFELAPLVTFYKNSIIVAIISTILNLLIFSMAAYVLVKCRFKLKGLITLLFSAALVIPGAACATWEQRCCSHCIRRYIRRICMISCGD